MQLFELNVDQNGVTLGKEIHPVKYKEICISQNGEEKTKKCQEKDLEKLIVEKPYLLNCDEGCESTSPELLIISEQLQSETRKKCDLLALDKKGYLVTIEIKRDADDEKARAESMEFQGIRYAASHRTLTIDGIIDIYAKFLQPKNQQNNDIDEETRAAERLKYQEKAIKNICSHLENDDPVTADTLKDHIIPAVKQKIYLVAADFVPDCLSACAWLREHEIEIYCFKLQPYKIGDKYVLNQERLIPPVALDDFYVATKEENRKSTPGSTSKTPTIKPIRLFWGEEEINCSSWANLLVLCIKKAIENGLAINENNIPCSFAYDEAETKNFYSVEALSINDQTLYIDKHGSSQTIITYIRKMLTALPKKDDLSITVELENGTSENLL